jgi:hypothetical protein
MDENFEVFLNETEGRGDLNHRAREIPGSVLQENALLALSNKFTQLLSALGVAV